MLGIFIVHELNIEITLKLILGKLCISFKGNFLNIFKHTVHTDMYNTSTYRI